MNKIIIKYLLAAIAVVVLLYLLWVCIFSIQYDVRSMNGTVYFYGFKNDISNKAAIPTITPWFSRIEVISRVCIKPGGPKILVIPDTIQAIETNCSGEEWGFAKMSNLESLIIGKGLANGLSGGMFADCVNLNDVSIDEKNTEYYVSNNCIINKHSFSLLIGLECDLIPDEVKSISSLAFYNNSYITQIDIPSNVENIETAAFTKCPNLIQVRVIKDSVIIEKSAFQSCNEGFEVYEAEQ